jgi:hypothetical protein
MPEEKKAAAALRYSRKGEQYLNTLMVTFKFRK